MRPVMAVIAATIQAAGPWLCCCVMAAPIALPAKAAAPSPDACSHCCHDTPPDTPTPPKQPPAPPCPCKVRLVATPPALPPDAAELPSDFAPTWVGLVEPAIIPAAVRPAPEALCPLPFLTAEVRLRVHHVMHC